MRPALGVSCPAIVRSVLCLSSFGVLSFVLGWVPLQVGLARVKQFEM